MNDEPKILILDTNKRIIYFNSALEYVFGYTAAEVLNKSLTLIIPNECKQKNYHGNLRFLDKDLVLLNNKIHQVTGRRKNGSELSLELILSSLMVGGEQQFLMTIYDYSEVSAFEPPQYISIESLRHQAICEHLPNAIEHQELELYYQPKASLNTGRISSAEALIRWNCSQLGQSISPVEFIPIAEKTGLILAIGEWVIHTACQQNKAWQNAGSPKFAIAVNVSPLQFNAGNLVQIVQRALRESKLEPCYLEIEITESAMLLNTNATIAQIKTLRQMDILVSLDDFGTGYSSLSFLCDFVLDKLKIDQSFVKEIASKPKSAAIANSTIALAHSMNMTVIAEGVETESQLGYLQKAGCDEIQGFIFSRPLDSAKFLSFVKENKQLILQGEFIDSEHTLLIVDDDPNIINALKRILRHQEYKILTADSGLEALELLAQNQVQVILSDQQMPKMNGAEFLSRVCQIYPTTVRMILSGYSDLESLTSAINHGSISKFICKPWDDFQLCRTIQNAFKLYERQQQFQRNRFESESEQNGDLVKFSVRETKNWQ